MKRLCVVALFFVFALLFSSPAGAQTGVSCEMWPSATLGNLQDLANNPDMLGPPASVTTRSIFEAPLNRTGRFIERCMTRVIPPVSGNYTFWIASNQFASLWFSTDKNFAGKAPIANQLMAVPPASRLWTRYIQPGPPVQQQSAKIYMVFGVPYYIMTIHMDPGDGSNYNAVGWQLPNGVYERPISATMTAGAYPGIRLNTTGYPVRVFLNASPLSISLGQSATLSWSAATGSVSSCSAQATPPDSAWTGSKSQSGGSATVLPAVTTTYSRTCLGPGGSDASYVTITVVQPVSVQLSASPQSLVLGQQATLTWSSQNATSCSASASPADSSWSGSIPLSGSAPVLPSINSTYYVSCSRTGNSNSAQASFSVTGVAAVVNPRMVEFDPSADHNAVIPEESPNAGLPVVSRYDLGFYYPGAAQPVSTYNLGKPNPEVDGKIRYDFTSHLVGFPIGTFEARVTVVGPSGSGTSEPSNPFSFIR